MFTTGARRRLRDAIYCQGDIEGRGEGPWPGRDQMERAKAEGVDHYLVRPFQTVQLRDSLEDIFRTVQ
jgi:hypothetical protein